MDLVAVAQSLTCSNCGSSDSATLFAAFGSILVAIATARRGRRDVPHGTCHRSLGPGDGRPAGDPAGASLDQYGVLGCRALDPEPPVALDRRTITATVGVVVVILGHAGERGFCSVPVRNVGAGLARVLFAQIRVMLRGAITRRQVCTLAQLWSRSKGLLPSSGSQSRINFLILRPEGGDAGQVMSVSGQPVTVAEAFAGAVERCSGIWLAVRYCVAADAEEAVELSSARSAETAPPAAGVFSRYSGSTLSSPWHKDRPRRLVSGPRSSFRVGFVARGRVGSSVGRA